MDGDLSFSKVNVFVVIQTEWRGDALSQQPHVESDQHPQEPIYPETLQRVPELSLLSTLE